jgi:hypothetical protein
MAKAANPWQANVDASERRSISRIEALKSARGRLLLICHDTTN